jgi:hypothetical protein
MSIAIGALAAIPATFLAWLAYNWAGKPVLDVRSARLDALKAAELYGFIGYGHGDEETNKAKAALNEAATELRSLSRGQPWAAKLYCHPLGYDLELAGSSLVGLAGLTGAFLGPENSSRRDSVDAVHILLNANKHLDGKRVIEIKQKLRTHLALPRGI